jgi:hypothetical protein
MRAEQEPVIVTSEEAPKSSPAEMAKRRPAKAKPAPRPNTVQMQKAEFSAIVVAYAEKNLGKPGKRWTPEQVEEAAEFTLFLLSKRVDSRPTVVEPQVSKRVKDPIISLFQNWIAGYTEQELPQWRFEGGWHPWAVRKRVPQVGLSLGFLGEFMSDGWKPESHGLRVPMHPRNVTRQAQPKRQKQPA